MLMVKKRNGNLVEFDKDRIANAIKKAVVSSGEKISSSVFDDLMDTIVSEVENQFTTKSPSVEEIQDIVERSIVKKGLYELSKEYILYRAKRNQEREERKKEWFEKATHGELTVIKKDGTKTKFDPEKITSIVERSIQGNEGDVSVETILKEFMRNIYDGITTEEIYKALILATISFIELDPAYGRTAANIFLERVYKEVFGESVTNLTLLSRYRTTFAENIKKGVDAGIYDKRLLDFDLEKLSRSIDVSRDKLLGYIGIQTLYERYFLRKDDRCLELPQAFWMRVAMGLAINEDEKEEKAAEFYDVLSSLRFVSSTPTLFHSGLTRPQLSSCYLSKVDDDLDHIFKCIGDNAQMSKWSGGIGNDWTSVRATGALIKSTRVESQGIVPFLKIANDTTLAINRSGKRRGATCAYLETWHLDIEDFLDLRKNTGDERRRTHDMNTANWVPDLFMKRVMEDENWTLFSPEEVPDLHETYGRDFEKRYVAYEKAAQEGKIKKSRSIPAVKLWRKMLTRLFETGHPWITFKDPSNVRSPQDHAGVVHNSNLCTEITLNDSADETAVCNLGSVNLERHVQKGEIHRELVADTVSTAMRMLDNVIDINFYPTKEAKNSNLRHRPVGLGLMGFQDALFKLDIPFESNKSLEFADEMMEIISYNAILGSSQIAKEKGTYESYKGSKWERGLFPLDTLSLLEEERGMKIPLNKESSLDWTPVRDHVKKYGMRNSNTMAIAPTATIANISGVFPCIEPIYKNIYVKSNMSGEFTVVNEYLVNELKELGLWTKDMLEQIKYHDGNLDPITSIPDRLKEKYKEAFDVDPKHLIDLTAVRGKWIDQSQSHNIFIKGVSGKKIDDVYKHAWKMGLKTTYYMRSLAATQIEKSTLDAKKYGYTQKRDLAKPKDQEKPKETQKVEEAKVERPASQVTNVCSIMDPDCESCQ